jgi:NAD(P)-dependent dehydrogenase (short-subunit alcohol dehydrogenase family)
MITGAASGIGLACARRFVVEGGRVAILDRDDTRGPAQAAELGSAAEFIKFDAASDSDWADAAARVAAGGGRLDVLINCAAMTESGTAVDVAHAGNDHIRRTFGVNFDGAWAGIRALLPHLTAARGAIVNVASRAAVAAMPAAPAYAASKAALVSLTRSVALQCARENRGVRCNAVLPGSVDTPMWRPLSGDGKVMTREQGLATGLPHIPMARLAQPEEVAAAVLFLASDDASYITGTALLVDGGQSCL